MTDVVQILVTAGSRDEADRIAGRLLERRLAACVQILGPISSRYWWRGTLESAEEWLCIAKTTAEAFDRAADVIRAVHSYEVPEITAIPVVAGLESYLQWVGEETAGR